MSNNVPHDASLVCEPNEQHGPFDRGLELAAPPEKHEELLERGALSGRIHPQFLLGVKYHRTTHLKMTAKQGHLDALYEYGKQIRASSSLQENANTCLMKSENDICRHPEMSIEEINKRILYRRLEARISPGQAKAWTLNKSEARQEAKARPSKGLLAVHVGL